MKRIKRIMLKLTGELFEKELQNISFERYDFVAKQILKIQEEAKVQIGIVVGGGNIFRGREANTSVDRSEADAVGMLATISNGILLREALVRHGAINARLMTAIDIHQFAEPYIKNKARHHLDENRLVIIAGGLGKPYFSTDSAVAQYANEINCDIIFKASTIDGVYDSDPNKNRNAKKYKSLTYREAINKNLKILDQTAFAMCEESQIPIFVFDVKNLHELPKVIKGDYSIGTLIHK
ncbi:MAG: UMP kinase [bacterium]|nr:MAG: UMP kinase [bacterium]